MRFLNYIDRKLTAKRQKTLIVSYFIGVPIGHAISQIISFISISNYHYNILNTIFIVSFNLLLFSPLIINYFLHKRKYDNIIKRIKPDKELKVKAIFNFDDFIKNKVYKIENISILTKYGLDKQNSYLVVDDKGFHHRLKDIINKFELDDIKEERLKKLKKLKRLW